MKHFLRREQSLLPGLGFNPTFFFCVGSFQSQINEANMISKPDLESQKSAAGSLYYFFLLVVLVWTMVVTHIQCSPPKHMLCYLDSSFKPRTRVRFSIRQFILAKIMENFHEIAMFDTYTYLI